LQARLKLRALRVRKGKRAQRSISLSLPLELILSIKTKDPLIFENEIYEKLMTNVDES
jgi:hypothetical protein